MGPWEGLPFSWGSDPIQGDSAGYPFTPPQLCIHAQNGRKCQYVGNCSFAHSPEERDMWTFMKDNKSEWEGRAPARCPLIANTPTHQQAQDPLRDAPPFAVRALVPV